MLFKYHTNDQDLFKLKSIPKEHLNWVKQIAKRSAIAFLSIEDELMADPHHYGIMISHDIQLQRHLLKVYHDSPVGIHRGREATYGALSHDFYWRNMAHHVRNWIRRCPDCIRFKSTDPKHGPMQVRMCEHSFHTIDIDYVGPLPSTSSGNKWILNAVCQHSNFL